MAGITRRHTKSADGRAFPASRYENPRGGRASALERNILRYRAIETTLYLFYAEEIRNFMLTDVHRAAATKLDRQAWDPSADGRLPSLLASLLRDAEAAKKMRAEDADALRRALARERQQGKTLKVAFAYAISIGMYTEAEAAELKTLLDYRNDIAHRIHLIMSDISRNHVAVSYAALFEQTYKGEALERLRAYRRTMWMRARGRFRLTAPFEGTLFELAERVFEEDLKRLDRLIESQIVRERARYAALQAELDLRDTNLLGDLSPRFPANHRSGREGYSDEYFPPTGHLTRRGVEICYRLFDLGKSPMAVAYLMGMTLRSAERRRERWTEAGGVRRIRADVERYDVQTLRLLPSGVGHYPQSNLPRENADGDET